MFACMLVLHRSLLKIPCVQSSDGDGQLLILKQYSERLMLSFVLISTTDYILFVLTLIFYLTSCIP